MKQVYQLEQFKQQENLIIQIHLFDVQVTTMQVIIHQNVVAEIKRVINDDDNNQGDLTPQTFHSDHDEKESDYDGSVPPTQDMIVYMKQVQRRSYDLNNHNLNNIDFAGKILVNLKR